MTQTLIFYFLAALVLVTSWDSAESGRRGLLIGQSELIR